MVIVKVKYKYIPDKVNIIIDNGGIKGSKFKDESIVLPGVRRFVYDHIMDCKEILKEILKAGLTISLEKSKFGKKSIDIVGFRCDEQGRQPLASNVNEIKNW
ncbi:hypothetical protein AX774_g3799 [Zancudomyces culisetae]|uniref:Uncharacterized protein n=1 Tax=Zancudomyces culisetae TaxID=1213189 RepID=A0A1R1PP32_ZANCU|nr:hypothetical protein AX774_g3799 [Zancudomyces culisetae]|eukprot:OMH82714.1 hypothetical protein AX774_g3799 [Zancudomyces culisetae]